MELKSFTIEIPQTAADLSDFETLILEQLSNSFQDNVLNFHIPEIIKNSNKIEFISKYEMRPDLVAWDQYNSAALGPFILFINKCTSLFTFTRINLGDKLLVPDAQYMKKLLTSKI